MKRPNVCCADFEHALRPHTDNEPWGSVFHWFEYPGFYVAGTHKSPLVYCPWCGKELGNEETATQ